MATIIARPDRIRATNQRVEQVAVAHKRLMLLLILFSAALAMCVLKLAYFGVFAGSGRLGNGGADSLPARADIVDRNGVPLARTIDAYSITVRKQRLMGDRAELARKLAAIFPDESESKFYQILTGPGKWAYIRRRALPDQVAAVNALGEVAFEFPREKDRLYPQRTLAAHVLGFVSSSGGMGAERAFNERLTDPAQLGKPLALSIDARVQGALESELYSGMVANTAKAAAGIVLDVRTGEVLAMASLPVFNPNKLERDNAKFCDETPRCNDVVQARYELGSTFKPLSIGAAMDAGVVTSMSRRYDATAPLPIAGFKIKDDHPSGRWLNVPETLVHSSNIVTARIADELGGQRLSAIYRQLEFDRRPSIELGERATTLWPSSWGRVTTMTTAYGHGIAVTPLHLASGYAALVNGGIWHPATLRKLSENEIPQGRRVFSAATSLRMRGLLRLIVAEGTGRNADAKGFRVGGKTGTAEKPFEGGYAHHSLVTTFVAVFPMDSPRYVVLTMMDEPHGSAEFFGGRTAAYTSAPVAKRVIEKIGPMLGIFPDAKRDIDISDLTPLLWKAPGDTE